MMMPNKPIYLLLFLIAILITPLKAQQAQPYPGTMPQTQFRSTSAMTGTQSAYAATPVLNADGTASYNGASCAPAAAHSRPRKVAPITPTGNPTPIGDGLWILLGMAVVAIVIKKEHLCHTSDKS